MNSNQSKLKHLEWAIESRHINQKSSLRLLSLFKSYGEIWKTKKFSRAAQDLTGVAFSLWRAAFLAEKSGSRAAVFDHGTAFLEKVIDENAISFPNDKKSREWTFNYYTRNARCSLQVLNKYWPEEVAPYAGKKRNPTERWEYCQQLLDDAVTKFERRLKTVKLKMEQINRARTVRVERDKRRATVRKMTLAGRN
jgi:hypothetical protein